MTARTGGRSVSLLLVILAGFFATIGILLLFMAGMLTPRVSRLLEQNAIERTRQTALTSTGGLELYVDAMLGNLHFVSGIAPRQADTTDPTFQTQIEFMQKSQADIRNIALFASDGRMLYSATGEVSISRDWITQSEWFRKALAWQGTVPFFSAPHVQHIFGSHYEWVVTMAKAVDYTENGRSQTGVLLIDYDFNAIASLLSDTTLGTNGYLYLIDTQDTLLYHPRQQLIYAGLDREDLTAVAAQVTGLCRDEQDGRGRVLFIHTVAQTRWRLVGVAYTDEVLSLQSAFVRMFTVALISGALLSIAAATLTAYFVTRPIRELQRTMRRVEAGDLNTAIEVQGFKEIRALSLTFRHMLERIRMLMDQIVREQELKRLHELNALQAQINPHFLYNTMDSIIWMEERGNSKEAITMVSALARLFRISISKGRNIITVREEMEHVRNYLIIQKMRFRNKFTYEIAAAEDTLELRTIKLIVQPIVENAVHHAIDAYDERTLHIAVATEIQEDCLVITIHDDGIGIPEAKLETILTTPAGKSGIGLKNVHERIQLTCGREYGLSIESVEDEGTRVTIRLPLRLEAQG